MARKEPIAVFIPSGGGWQRETHANCRGIDCCKYLQSLHLWLSNADKVLCAPSSAGAHNTLIGPSSWIRLVTSKQPTRNQVPGNRLRVRLPCPPLEKKQGS